MFSLAILFSAGLVIVLAGALVFMLVRSVKRGGRDSADGGYSPGYGSDSNSDNALHHHHHDSGSGHHDSGGGHGGFDGGSSGGDCGGGDGGGGGGGD